jgi:hypothetical protein
MQVRTRTMLAWSLWLTTFGCCAAGRPQEANHLTKHIMARGDDPQLQRSEART